MKLKEAIATGLPFKAAYHVWLFNPAHLPQYILDLQHKGSDMDYWEVGTFEALNDQEIKFKKSLTDTSHIP